MFVFVESYLCGTFISMIWVWMLLVTSFEMFWNAKVALLVARSLVPLQITRTSSELSFFMSWFAVSSNWLEWDPGLTTPYMSKLPPKRFVNILVKPLVWLSPIQSILCFFSLCNCFVDCLILFSVHLSDSAYHQHLYYLVSLYCLLVHSLHHSIGLGWGGLRCYQ